MSPEADGELQAVPGGHLVHARVQRVARPGGRHVGGAARAQPQQRQPAALRHRAHRAAAADLNNQPIREGDISIIIAVAINGRNNCPF